MGPKESDSSEELATASKRIHNASLLNWFCVDNHVAGAKRARTSKAESRYFVTKATVPKL